MADFNLLPRNDDITETEFKAAIDNLQSIASGIGIPSDAESRVSLHDINFAVQRALVKAVVDSTEEQIEKLVNAEEQSAMELAMVIRPRLELIHDLMRRKERMERLVGADLDKNNPDLQRCFYNIDNTLNYMSESLTPLIEQYQEARSKYPEREWLQNVMEQEEKKKGIKPKKRVVGW